MREINNKNINGVNFTSIQKTNTESTNVPEAPTVQAETKEINDLNKVPSASLGKTQVSSDTTENDMLFLLKNPKEVEQLNMIFDKYQESHSYEEATQLIDAYKREFYTKK